MTLQQLIDIPASRFEGKNILIIGYPASGKSHVCNKLADKCPTHKIIHTDDYMQHGFEQSLYVLLNDVKEDPLSRSSASFRPTLIEGILGYRLLRKGVEQDNYYPDIVIELNVTNDQITEVYQKERNADKLKSVMSSCKACQTILIKYLAMDNARKPEWLVIENEFHVKNYMEKITDIAENIF